MLSFYETGVLARRATRGAGYDWGLAEEATFAAGWLCDYGVDGADVLSRYLRRVDGQTVASRAVRAWPSGDVWEGDTFGNSPLCPLCLGAALSDFGLPSGVEKVVISAVYAPVLLLPFIANLPAEDGKIWTIEGDITDDINPARVVIIRADAKGSATSTKKNPRYPQKEDAFLLELAQRTYVPESEASRAKGAG